MIDQHLVLLAGIRELYELGDVLIYGSSLSQAADSLSDIDVIGAKDLAEGVHNTLLVHGGRLVDMHVCSPQYILRSLQADVRTNNNYMLFACATGKAIPPVSAAMTRLTREARTVWEAGPKNVVWPEANQLAEALIKVAGTALQLQARAERDRQLDGETHLKACLLFNRTVYLYCRACRLWSSSLDEMLRWVDESYSGIQSVIRDFYQASQAGAQLRLVKTTAVTALEVLMASLEKNALPSVPWISRVEALSLLIQSNA